MSRPRRSSPLQTVRNLASRAAQRAMKFAAESPWRLVVFLALLPLVIGALVTWIFRNGPELWVDIGTGLIGGSVIGLIFAMVQHTLDRNQSERDEQENVRFTVSSNRSLVGIDLRHSTLPGSHLRSKEMAEARLDFADFSGSDFFGADLRDASLVGTNLSSCDLQEALLNDANLHHANMSDAMLSGADISNGRLVDTNLRRANLEGLQTATRVDLSRAQLDDADLRDTTFVDLVAPFMTVQRANLTRIHCEGADFSCIDARDASFAHSKLSHADFTGADLRGAVLNGADLRHTRLVGARLDGASFTGAIIDETTDFRLANPWDAHFGRDDIHPAIDTSTVLASTTTLTPSTNGVQAPSAVLAPSSIAQQPTTNKPFRVRLEYTNIDPQLTAALQQTLAARCQVIQHLHDALHSVLETVLPPDWGTARDHGLCVLTGPTAPPRNGTRGLFNPGGFRNQIDATVQLRIDDDGAVWVRHEFLDSADTQERRITKPQETTEVTGATLASAVQFGLTPDDQFREFHSFHALQNVLDQAATNATTRKPRQFASNASEPDFGLHSSQLRRVLDQILATNPTNPLILSLQAWTTDQTNLTAVHEAIDGTRIAWAHAQGVRRALAGARLASLQCQVLHRSESNETTRLLTRARAAGDAALSKLLEESTDPWLDSTHRTAYLGLTGSARSFAEHVDEHPDSLDSGIRRYREVITLLEDAQIQVPNVVHNNLGYCLMTRAGRFVQGPGGTLYAEAQQQFDTVMATFGVEAGTPPSGERIIEQVQYLVDEALTTMDRDSMETELRMLRLALANRGNLYRLHKLYDVAHACYDAALIIMPGYVEGLAEKSWVYTEGTWSGTLEEMHATFASLIDAIVQSSRANDPQKIRALSLVAQGCESAGYVDLMDLVVDRARLFDPPASDEFAARLAALTERHTAAQPAAQRTAVD